MLRGDLLRALWRVGRNGALLGFGAAAGLVVWTGAWNLADPRDLSWDGLTLRPEAVVAAVVIAVIAILTRSSFRRNSAGATSTVRSKSWRVFAISAETSVVCIGAQRSAVWSNVCSEARRLTNGRQPISQSS